MRFIAEAPAAYLRRTVGSGHCVAYVQEAARAPHTSAWRMGPRVRDAAGLPSGLAIATFGKNGRYENDTSGRSHAAILASVTSDGLLVWDQWVGRPVAQRVIRFKAGQGDKVNDGDAFHVILADDAPAT